MTRSKNIDYKWHWTLKTFPNAIQDIADYENGIRTPKRGTTFYLLRLSEVWRLGDLLRVLRTRGFYTRIK